uniref:RING-type domain-containing protein n=1 Tax=Globodera rostochiensis TaxID=31243 RepID=A0A914HP67_GLORO
MGDENASTSQQQQFTEYQISIPVNLTRFFKHKILLLDMVIYQYEESIYFINKLSNSKEPHEDKTCSICLDNIEIEEKIVKLHGENGNNLMHIFHSNCINTWFERLEKLICPFCKQEPKNIMSISFPPIFDWPNYFALQMGTKAKKTILNEVKRDMRLKKYYIF